MKWEGTGRNGKERKGKEKEKEGKERKVGNGGIRRKRRNKKERK